MKSKTKLIATLMALCLVVTLGVFGILAVKTLNMSVGGNITFNADGVSFTIGQGKFYQSNKTTEYAGITTQTGKMQGFAMNTNTKLEDVEEEITSWTGLELVLDSQGDAVLKFNIKNDMSDKQLYVMFTVTEGTNTNDNMRIICETSELIEPTDNKNVTITFDILDDSINAGLTGFKIDLNIGEPVQVNASTGVVEGANQNNTKYSNAKYTLNTTNHTASVSANVCEENNYYIEGDVVIIDKVYVDGQEYVVTEISSFFETCISSVIIPKTITKIAGYAFCRTCLTSVVIPESVRTIGTWAFGQTSLTSVVIENGVTEIGDSAFCETYITDIILPVSVAKIGESCFDAISTLSSITILASTPPSIESDALNEEGSFPIYVLGASVHLYKTATNWNAYKDRIQAIPGTEGDQVAMPKTINMAVTSPGNQYLGYQNIFYKIDNSEWFDNKNWVYVEGLYTETLAATNTIRFVKVIGENVNEVPSDVEYININEQSYTSAIIGIGTYLVVSLESEVNDRYYFLGADATIYDSWQLDVSEFADDVINLRVYWDDD